MKAIKIQFFLSSLSVLLMISCNKKKEDFPMNSATTIDKDFYLTEALIKGDTSAYSNLSDYYMDAPIEHLLYPALIMANKYDYHLAYADVYRCLTSQDHKQGISELEGLDEKTRSMALEYLKLGAEKGNKECKKILGQHFIDGKYLKKDVSKGQRLIEEGEQ